MIDISKVTRVYSGKPGCMCGCNGKYYSPETSQRTVTRIVNELNANLDTEYNEGAQCYWVVTPTRNVVAFIGE